jgi:integrase/recombinase XerC
MVDSFLNHLKFEKRYSVHTLTAYKSDLIQFSNFLVSNYDIDQVHKASFMQIRSYMAELMDEGMQPVTVNRKLISLRTYYKYLLQENIIDKNPMTKVLSPKSGTRLPGFIEENKMEKLVELKPESTNFTTLRDSLIVQMLYQTGMRLSELKNLKTANINLAKSELKVLGKRNKERIIPFTTELKHLISGYLQIKNTISEADTEYLFILDNGKPIYEKFIYRTVTAALGNITTAEKKSPHVLRHTYASHLLNNGANINAIKELLGHTSLAATQIYTHNNIEQLKKAHKNAHPRA